MDSLSAAIRSNNQEPRRLEADSDVSEAGEGWSDNRIIKAPPSRPPQAYVVLVKWPIIPSPTGKGGDALEVRPQLAAALAAAKRYGCKIVVAELDRLSRDCAGA